jgi:hypothetical protein
LFDSAGSTIIEAGLCNSGADHNIELEEGERILGVKSMFSNSENWWFGLTFVFGK